MADRKKEIKVKKKKWYQIVAPKLFGETIIGESIAAEPDSLIGRTVNANLMHLIGDVKLQSVNVGLRISSVEGERALTEPVSYELGPSSIKRFIRRNSERIDESFICETSDNKLVRIKPLFVTVAKAKGKQKSILRRYGISMIAKEVKKLTYENLLRQIVSNKMQTGLRNSLKPILPLRTCSIRKLSLVKKEKAKKIVSGELKLEMKGQKEREESTEKSAEKEESAKSPEPSPKEEEN